MKRNYQRYSAHHFDGLGTLPFSAAEYSRLKFGCDSAAKKFGYELAENFFVDQSPVLLANQVVVMPSPYNFVPNAASIMTQHFINRLNQLLVEANGEHVETSFINRKVSYTSDYGFMNKEDRARLIGNDKFNVNAGYIEGKVVICIDDIRITGVHEDKLREIFEEQNINVENVFFLYYAQYNGQRANIEAELNFAGVTCLEDYLALTHEPNHHLIVRPIKYMLGQTPEVFQQIIRQAPREFVERLYFACLGEGYYKIPHYQKNFLLIKQLAVDSSSKIN